jgi:hypothetical protein
VLSLRCALSHYLLQLATDPRQPVVFRVSTPSLGGAGVGMEVAGLMPTLFLIKDAMLQVRCFVWYCVAPAADAAVLCCC